VKVSVGKLDTIAGDDENGEAEFEDRRWMIRRIGRKKKHSQLTFVQSRRE